MEEKINHICEVLAGILIDIKDMRILSDGEIDLFKQMADEAFEKQDYKSYTNYSTVMTPDKYLKNSEERINHLIQQLGRANEYAKKRDEAYPDGDFLKELA